MARLRPLSERFWEKVDKTPGHGRDGDCWMWTSHVAKDGYGQFWVNEKKRAERPHRLSYLMATGQDPTGLLVCHKCDNPLCVRPDHLFLGTNSDNMADMSAKKRTRYHLYPETVLICQPGEKNPRSKLTESEVVSIIRRHRAGESTSLLAKEFGINRNHVLKLVRGERWGHVQALV